MLINLMKCKEEALQRAKAAVQDGLCIVLPTDTVYGIGADAFSASAVQTLLNAKHRSRDMPPPVLIADADTLLAMVDSVPEAAQSLIDHFWPGALTVILPVASKLRLDLGRTHGTIAVRVPDHDDARELLRMTGPMAVSSANISGQDSATNVEDAQRQLGDSVAVYLDGGSTPGPVPSTIVNFTTDPEGKLIRLGAISVEQLRRWAPKLDASQLDFVD